MDPITVDDIPELLSKLVDKSLVQVDADGRYSLLQLVRQYTQEESMRAGESTAIRDRHFEYFLAQSRTVRQRINDSQLEAEFLRVERDYEDFRLAVEWAIARQETWGGGAEITLGLFPLWFVRSYIEDGVRWVKMVADAAPLDSEKELSHILFQLATFQLRQWSPETAQTVEASLALARKCGDIPGIYRGLFIKAVDAWNMGRYDEARPLFDEAYQTCSSFGDEAFLGAVLVNRGNFALFQGRHEDAARDYAEIQRVWVQNPRGLSVVEANESHMSERKGDYQGAHRWALKALKNFVSYGDTRNTAATFASAASGFWAAGDNETAARLLGCSAESFEKSGLVGDPLDTQTYQRWESRLREAMGEAAFEAALSQGRLLTPEEAVEMLLANPEPWT